MNDQTIEQEIQAKGKTAPRITPADIEANIAHTDVVTFISNSRKVLRWAVITTRSGFAVTGEPSCAVSPENDDPEIGQRIAIDNAKREMWKLMGYHLSCDLHAVDQKELLQAIQKMKLSPADDQDFLSGKQACDQSGEGACEACQ